MRAFKSNRFDGGISCGLRRFQVLAQRRHAQDSPPVCHELLVFQCRTGVEDLRVRQGVRSVNPEDDFAFGVAPGITAAGHHHAHAGERTPVQFHPAQRTVHAGVEQFDEVVFQPRQIHLGFRVAKASIELQNFGAGLREHDSRIENSTEINPLGDKLEINISAKALARFISLNLPGKDVIFSDNFFDLPAGRSIQITCPNPDGWSIEQVHQALQIRSLANIIPAQPKIADDIKYYWIGLKPGNIINRILFSLIK